MKRSMLTLTALATAGAVGVVMMGPSATPTAAIPAQPTAAQEVAQRPGTGALVVDWNQELLTIQQTPGAQPATVHPTRALAIMHAAMYDAVASITHRDRPYLFQLDADQSARPDAAADQAAHDVLVAMYPTMQGEIDQNLHDELVNVPTGAATQAGIRVGHLTAALMLAARADDGSAATPPPFTVPAAAPGAYQLTPPNQPTPVFTNWGSIEPFVLRSGDQFRPSPPPDLASGAWAQAIGEVQRLGQDTSTARTPEQTTVAAFWAPPIWTTWNEIADGQVLARHSDLQDATKLFASMDLSVADTVVAMYDAKYAYDLWRPITAIRAGTPGNAAVTADPAWNAFANTAPDPSYPGAHSAVSAAAAEVLTRYLGGRLDLSVSSDAMPGATRHFTSFRAAAEEAGLSRIFAGQHTRIDHDAGAALGRDVARYVLAQPATRRS
jgi:membrane-associated phospholipid phosphatase